MLNISYFHFPEPNEYMAFGLSKNDSISDMNNADAIVAFMDKRKKGHAVDYFLGSKEQVRYAIFCKRCMYGCILFE